MLRSNLSHFKPSLSWQERITRATPKPFPSHPSGRCKPRSKQADAWGETHFSGFKWEMAIAFCCGHSWMGSISPFGPSWRQEAGSEDHWWCRWDVVVFWVQGWKVGPQSCDRWGVNPKAVTTQIVGRTKAKGPKYLCIKRAVLHRGSWASSKQANCACTLKWMVRGKSGVTCLEVIVGLDQQYLFSLEVVCAT